MQELTNLALLLIFGALLLGLAIGIIVTVILGRASDPTRRLAPQLEDLRRTQSELAEFQQTRQAELAGKLTQFADDTAKRDDLFRRSLDERLTDVSTRVGKSLFESQERSSQNLKQLNERLALIDRAQKNIEQLSGEVSGLQAVLSNKQSRGAFGEKQMNDIIESLLAPNAYSLQHTLSNGSRVDALIHLPSDQGDVAIDAKFPLEAWRALMSAETDYDSKQAAQRFRADLKTHINAIASKYLIFGETHEVALMFLPSEAIYAELHTRFPEVVETGFKAKVMIVSPTTFMATLHTMKAVMRDANMREQAHVILREVGKMGEDVRRLDERVGKLQRHFDQASEDVRGIRISTEKITSRAEKMEDLDRPDELPENVTPLRG